MARVIDTKDARAVHYKTSRLVVEAVDTESKNAATLAMGFETMLTIPLCDRIDKLEAENARSTAKGLKYLAQRVEVPWKGRFGWTCTRWDKKHTRSENGRQRAGRLARHWARVFERRAEEIGQ